MNYPNLEALSRGCTSGRISEWPLLPKEAAIALRRISELEAEVREAKAVSGVCVNAFKSFQMLMEGKISEKTFDNVIKGAEKDLSRAADWLKEYVDTLTVEVDALREGQERLGLVLDMVSKLKKKVSGSTGYVWLEGAILEHEWQILKSAKAKERGGM